MHDYSSTCALPVTVFIWMRPLMKSYLRALRLCRRPSHAKAQRRAGDALNCNQLISESLPGENPPTASNRPRHKTPYVIENIGGGVRTRTGDLGVMNPTTDLCINWHLLPYTNISNGLQPLRKRISKKSVFLLGTGISTACAIGGH